MNIVHFFRRGYSEQRQNALSVSRCVAAVLLTLASTHPLATVALDESQQPADHQGANPIVLAQSQEDIRRRARSSGREQSNDSQNNTQAAAASEVKAFSAPEACSFLQEDFDYETWSNRYLDYYDKYFDTPVTEAEVLAYQAEEAEKMGSIYRPPPSWKYDIWRVRMQKFVAAYGPDLTTDEKSALLATGWSNIGSPLTYFQKITELYRELNCDSYPGGGSPPGMYFGAIRLMATECNRNLSSSEKIPCQNTHLGPIARRGGNYELALAEFNKLTDKGSPDAMFHLGEMYLNGEGVAASRETAIDWYMSAGKGGHKQANKVLGDMFYHGDGVTVDRAEAIKWYSGAFDIDGMTDAQIAYNIGSELEREGNIPMATLCYARTSRSSEGHIDFVATAREKLGLWGLAGAQLNDAGVSAYDEEAGRFGYDFLPIDRRYSLEHLDPTQSLPPCHISLAEAAKESGIEGGRALLEALAEQGRRN